MQEQTVGVMYVGRKPFTVDRITGSGQVWNGRGDIKPVSQESAQILCNMPDQFWPEQEQVPGQEEVDKVFLAFCAGDRSLLKTISPTKEQEASQTDVTIDPIKPKKDLMQMNKKELLEYAFKEHGIRLKENLSVKDLRFEINGINEVKEKQ